ncbi:MAG: PilZ domain-containing protein [Desulfobacterales bacterium]
MKPRKDQRAQERNPCDDLLVYCSHFNKTDQFGARVQNVSESGLQFRSSRLLKVGSIVVVRFYPYSSDQGSCSPPVGWRNLSVAKVQWCRKAEDTADPDYEIGLKFLLPSV